MSTPLSWDHCRSFLSVLETGSLSAAARRLDLTQPTLARHIEQLEAALGGVSLFIRSPQGLSPTDTALSLEPHARAMAASAAALERAASGGREDVGGVVRISASEVVGGEVLPGMLVALREQAPRLSFEIEPSNQSADLLRRDADIAVRMVRPRQEALVARSVGSVPLGLFAREDYLAAHGMPESLDALRRHAIIGPDRETVSIQALRELGLELSRDTFAYRTDSDLAQNAALRAGFGVGICQVALARRWGRMVRLLPGVFAFDLPVWIVMHEDLKGVARMRVVFDHLVEAFAAYCAEGR